MAPRVIRPPGYTDSVTPHALLSRQSLLILTLLSMLILPTVLPLIAEIGAAHIRPTELLVVALWVILLSSRRAVAARFGFTAGIRKAMWIPAAFLVSAAALVIVDHAFASESVVSAVRYAEYFLIAPAVVLVCTSEAQVRDVAGRLRLALAAVILADSLAPIVASSGTIYVRQGVLVNPNALALLACGLIVLSILEPHWLKRRSRTSIVYLAIGLWGLYIARSLSGILALLVATWFLPQSARARWVTSIALFAAMIAVWRYDDIVGLLDFSGGTLAQRTAMVYAGLRTFLEAPTFGVGWQQSSHWLLESPDILLAAMSQFGGLPRSYFTKDAGWVGVHNAYIQLLAEIGVVGTVIVGVAFVVMIRRVSRRAPLPWLPLLVAIFAWHNAQLFYGGLPETALLWFTYGLAEASGRLRFRARAEPGVPGT